MLQSAERSLGVDDQAEVGRGGADRRGQDSFGRTADNSGGGRGEPDGHAGQS